MPHVTEVLDDEVGIQYQGVKDSSGGTGSYPIVGVITGLFKRGRYDKLMTITAANIRAMLGYEPNNPHYVAVHDALASGIPSVQVLRVKGEENLSLISCEGATSAVTFMDAEIYNDVRINGELFEIMKGSYGSWTGVNQAFDNKLNEVNLAISGGSSQPSQTTWYNQSFDYPIRVEIIPRGGTETGMSLAGLLNTNGSVSIDEQTGIIQFCLAPNNLEQ